MNDNDFDPNQQAPEEAHGEENTNLPSGEADRDFLKEEQESESSTAAAEETSATDSESTDSPEEPQTNQYGQPVPPYQQQQNQWQQPYTPYGQNNQYRYGQYNQYGQNGQYGQYGQSNQYGQYGQYGQSSQYGQPGQYGQSSQYSQPGQYGQYGQQQPQTDYRPYGEPSSPQPDGEPPKKKMNGGLKAFLLIIGILAVLFVLGFISYGIYEAYNHDALPKDHSQSTTSSQQLPGNSEPSKNNGVQGGVSGKGTNPNSPGLVIESQPATGELSAKEVYQKVASSVVSVITSMQNSDSGDTSQGSGIVATTDGYIITNAHVVNYSKSYQIKVILYNKKEYKGTVVGFDKTTDLAVIKINANDLTPARFGNADDLSVGDWVLAIGNPAGVEFSSSLTRGIISALNRKVDTYSANGMTYIQTDAAINPGNSGGALVNMYGQVVGINSIKIAATGYEGMGFAIPVSKAKNIVDALITNGYVSGRTRLGITAETVTGSQAQKYGVPQGVAIESIDSDSSLKGSDVVKGDIITKADGKSVASMEDLYAVLNTHKPGDTMTLTIYRADTESTKGKTFTVKIKLLEDKGETQGTPSSPSSK